MNRRIFPLVAMLALGGAACGEPRKDVGAFPFSSTGDTGSTSGDVEVGESDSTGTGGMEPRTSDDGGESGPGSDSGSSSGAIPPASCEGLDLVVAIDNSADAGGLQSQLSHDLPFFVNALLASVSADVRVLVVDSDAGTVIQACEECPMGESVCEGYGCGTASLLDECAFMLGAAVDSPYGQDASNYECETSDRVRLPDRGRP